MQYFFYIVFLLFFTACATHNRSEPFKSSKSFKTYEGETFNLSINSKTVILLNKNTQIGSLEKSHLSRKSLRWYLKEPISTPLNFKIEAVDNFNAYIGYLKPTNYEVQIFPLQETHLLSKKYHKSNPTVLLNGTPLVSEVSQLTQTKLPNGRYIIRVTVRGEKNWDRKELYVEVKNSKRYLSSGVSAPFTWYEYPIEESNLYAKSSAIASTASNKSEFESLVQKVSNYKKQGDYASALVYQKQLIVKYEALEERDKGSLADMYNTQALLHKKRGEYQEALRLNKKSLDLHLEEQPKDYNALSINYDTMGVLYHTLGQNDLAIKFLKKALLLREEHFPKSDKFLGESYNNLAVVFESIGNHKEALEYFKRSLKIRQEILGKSHQDTASTYSAMGSVYEQLHQYDKAVEYHSKAIEILKDKSAPEALASAYGGVAILYLREHRYKEALKFYEKILSIYATLEKKRGLKGS